MTGPAVERPPAVPEKPKAWHPEVTWTPGLTGEAKYGKTPSRDEKSKRIAIVADLLVAGFSRRSLRSYLAANTDWRIAERTVGLYVTEASARLAKLREDDAREALALVQERYDETFRRAMGAGNYSAAIRATREFARLHNLYPDMRRRSDAGLTPTDPVAEPTGVEPDGAAGATAIGRQGSGMAARANTVADLLAVAHSRLADLAGAGDAAPDASLPIPVRPEPGP